VSDAVLVDWEDMAAAPCASGRCFYIADIGDNAGARAGITVYEVAEPSPGATETAPARALNARYPDGAHNAEALVALGDALYIITKGTDGPISLYRFPAESAGDSVVTLVRVREAMGRPRSSRDLVTGAAASADGAWVAVRTYAAVHFYRARAFVEGAHVEPLVMSLSALGESQGEAITFGADGVVWLSSEAEEGGVPRLTRLLCTLP
jgi:hypothetical protein